VLGGDASQSMCAEITKALNGAAQDFDPAGSGCGVTGPWQYDPVNNPRGTRCTLQDYNVNALGRRPGDGFANLPVDEVGVQWGLHALEAGTITPEQFVDLNEKVGGLDVDFKWQPKRTAGDVAGIERMYQTDELSYGANWAQVPEIEARTDDTYDEHSNVMHLIARARLDDAAGGHANQVFWQEPVAGPFGLPTPDMHQLTFQVMDQWLTKIDKDHSDASPAEKVVRDKPAAAKDGCYANAQPAPDSACDNVRTANVLPIMGAGLLPARRRCVDRRRFTFTLHRPRGARVVRVAVYVDGRRTRLVRGHSIRRLTIRRLPRGRFVVDIVATRSNGTRLVSTRTYHGCAKSRPHLRLGRSRHHQKRS